MVVVLDRNWHCYVIDAFGTANNGLAIHWDPFCDKDMRLFLASDIWRCLLYVTQFRYKRKVNFVDIWMNDVSRNNIDCAKINLQSKSGFICY